MGYCPFSKVESRYNKLYCDTGHGLGAHGQARHDRAGAQGLAATLRHGPMIQPGGPTT